MCFQWIDEKVKKLNCFDYSIVKLCVLAFALLVAKFWPPILSLDWYWYAGVFAATYVYLIWKILLKRS